MFKVASEATFKHEVTAFVPVDGGFDKQKFKVTYRVLPAEEGSQSEVGASEAGSAFFRKVIVRLDEIAGPDGEELTYNDEVRERVIALPYARLAILRGYFSGISKAGEGN